MSCKRLHCITISHRCTILDYRIIGWPTAGIGSGPTTMALHQLRQKMKDAGAGHILHVQSQANPLQKIPRERDPEKIYTITRTETSRCKTFQQTTQAMNSPLLTRLNGPTPIDQHIDRAFQCWAIVRTIIQLVIAVQDPKALTDMEPLLQASKLKKALSSLELELH